MSLLRVNHVSKAFGSDVLFNNISFDINQGEKVALIGKNGTGKSTLFKMIIQEETPDEGEIFIHGQTKIGYLSQKIIEDENHSLYEEVLSVFQSVIEIENRLHQITHEMAENHSDVLLKRYAAVEEEFQRVGGYEYLVKIDTLLSHFGFHKSLYQRKVKTFSGGEKTRIALAKLLMIEPDILLLDEPTNHMDIEIIEWLEDYLKAYPKAVLIITHDKYFINKVCRKIIELDQRSIQTYHGDYDTYEAEKVKRYSLMLKQYERQQKEIDHLQSFVDRFRYKAKKARSAQDRIKKINRIERLEKPTLSKQKVQIALSSKRPTKVHIIELDDLSIGYDRPLLSHIHFKMRGIDKVGVIGPNGSGKTTLIKTIMGSLEPLYGEVKFHKQLKIGYFDQNLRKFNPSKTLLETIQDAYPSKTLTELRTDLAKVMFYKEDVYKPIHVDVFEGFEGPIIFISHDRYFINKVATKIISISDHVAVYDGNYTDYIGQTTRIKEEKKAKIVKQPRKQNIDKQLKKIELDIQQLEEHIEHQKSKLFEESVYMNPEQYRIENRLLEELEQTLLERYEELDSLLKKEY